MAFFTARCIRDSSTCQRSSWPVNSFFHRFFCGKSYCHLSFLLPEGYFESRALGRLTAPNPSSKSFWWIFLTSSICFFRFYLTDYMSLIQDAFPGILFLNCDSGFAFLFWTEAPFFSKKEDCLKKTALSNYSLRNIIIGSISSFLILNSGKDCKGWRSQFRSVAKEWR